MNIDKIANAIEADAGRALPGLTESLAEMQLSIAGRTPSMFESSFGDSYHKGEVIGIEKDIEQTTKNIAIKLAKEGTTIDIIAKVTEVYQNQILNKF